MTHEVSGNAARRRWLLGFSCLSFLIALLWKEMALSLPLVIAVFGLFYPNRAKAGESQSAEKITVPTLYSRIATAFLFALPYLGVTALYVILRIRVLGYFAKAPSKIVLSGWQLAGGTLELSVQYCRHLLWPFPLTTWYVFHPPSGLTDIRVIAAAAVLLALVLAILFLARSAPLAAFCIAWVLLTIVPVLNIRNIAGPTVFYERYLYIPSLGFCLLLPLGWEAVWRKIGGVKETDSRTSPIASRYAAIGVTALLVVISMAAVRARVPEWNSDATLCVSALRYAPDSSQLHGDLGNEKRSTGDYDGAYNEYQTALRLALASGHRSEIAVSYLDLSGIEWKRGRAQESLDFAQRGLQYDNELQALKTAEALALLQMNRVDEAERALSFALSPSANDAVAVNTLGTIAAERGEFATAIRYFKRALQIDPEFADGYFNLGLAEAKSSAFEQAIPHLQRATELQPRDPEYMTTYGAALLRSGRLGEAQLALQRALQIAPGYPEAVRNLNLLNQKLAGR